MLDIFGIVKSGLTKLFRPVTKVYTWAKSKLGEPIDYIYSGIRKLGIAYDRIKQYQDVVEAANEGSWFQRFYATLGFKEKPSQNMMIESKLSKPYKYRTAYKANLLNVLTGEIESRTMSVYHDRPYTIAELNQITDQYMHRSSESQWLDSGKSYEWSTKSVEVLSIWHEKDAPY